MENLINNNGSADGVEVMKESNNVSIGVASPETIKLWSKGEIKSAETINYRTFKPEKGGLFCEVIFGPQKDYECSCGRYKRIRHKGVVCEKCGVEVTQARVRRERMGHIELAVPVSHVWFYKCLPSRLALMLAMSQKALDQVLYYEKYVVLEPGNNKHLKPNQILSQEEYDEAMEQDRDGFKAGMGAAAIKEILAKIDLQKLHAELTETLQKTGEGSQQLRKTTVKRIRLVEGFLYNKMEPSWMILTILPVIPPDLRPLVPLEGGRFATSDLNDLYRRVINRNMRLKNLLKIHTPEVIIRNEMRMLQEAVDALLDNGRHGRAVTGANNRELKSLTAMLKGKQGRFRQNLLGKRVDYSGRSVIVVGPELNINQCGLPKEMALRLFEPFIIRRLKANGLVGTVRNAKKWIETRRKEVWDVLDDVVSGHPIMLNRAPTLHRLSIQAFDPVLIDGQAIRLHPLVCAAFNADFDGDQMAVHVPLSNEAQMECKLLMLAPHNVFSPAHGKPLTIPSQDMVLGVYYLCYEDARRKQAFLQKPRHEQLWFDDYKEVLRALEAHNMADETNHNKRFVSTPGLDIHDFINLKNPYYRSEKEQERINALPEEERRAIEAEDNKMVWSTDFRREKYLVTTPGRCIYHEIWPKELGFWNQKAVKKDIAKMIKQCYESCGHEELCTLLDRLKNLGYSWATRAGFTIAIDDMLIPEEKSQFIQEAAAEVEKARQEMLSGAITEKERRGKCVDIWTQVRNKLSKVLQGTLSNNRGRSDINNVWAMLESGARGSADQVTQLGGMRGLMADPNGTILETPILHNFREGLTGLEYFNSTHGSRKGLADTALKTADAGYMTRRLVDVAHDVICTEEDCGTFNGIFVEPIRDGNKITLSLEDRISGRFAVDDIYDSEGRLLVGSGEEITPLIARSITKAGIQKVHIRSVLTCKSGRGVCAKCYGRNLATGELPMEGDALGIIAAQSIGEPGTQLTLRTFHTGGTASSVASSREIINRWEQMMPELQQKVLELEAKAKRNAWKDEKLQEAKQKLLDKENVAFLVFEGINTIQGKVEGGTGNIVVSRDGKIRAYGATFAKGANPTMSSNELAVFEIPYGAVLKVKENELVKANAVLAEIDPFSTPVIAQHDGEIRYADLLDGLTIRIQTNEQSGKTERVVKSHSESEHPALNIIDPKDPSKIVETANLPEDAVILVDEYAVVQRGDIIAKMPRAQAKTSDITTGLPRVAELFEARRPRDPAVISSIEGRVEIVSQSKNKVNVRVRNEETGESCDHIIPTSKRIIVNPDDFVVAGERLTDGAPVLQEYLDICGPQKLQSLLVNAVQGVYLAQGVDINDKHIEIIVRQMMRKIRITNANHTSFLYGETVDQRVFDSVNAKFCATHPNESGASGQQMLLGITKASLATDSFISAASFQDTPRILTEASTLGRVDYLRGFKENVIMGHLIPAGTGYFCVQNPSLKFVDEEGNSHVITDNGKREAVPGVEDEDLPANRTPIYGNEISEEDLLENGAEISNSPNSRTSSEGADFLNDIN